MIYFRSLRLFEIVGIKKEGVQKAWSLSEVEVTFT